MKTLNNYISEWKANTNTVSSIEKRDIQCFVHRLKDREFIKIFEGEWPQYKDYKDKVYINGKKVELDENGFTNKLYNKGEYHVIIDEINNVTNCQYMFYGCRRLVEIPLFDTSKVELMSQMFSYCNGLISIPLFNTKNVTTMSWMFEACENLKEVPLFDTSKLKNATGMFNICYKLNNETKKAWSHIYNFENK